MDYKANWERFGKGGDYEYTVGDIAFPMPSDYINDRRAGAYMPYNMDEYRKLYEMIDEWRRENMRDISHLWEGEAKDRISIKVEYDNNFMGNLYRPGAYEISEVIFNNPATVVYWKDGTKTVVTDMDNVVDGKAKPAESYSKETGLALCYMKKALGNEGNYNNAFRKWIKED